MGHHRGKKRFFSLRMGRNRSLFGDTGNARQGGRAAAGGAASGTQDGPGATAINPNGENRPTDVAKVASMKPSVYVNDGYQVFLKRKGEPLPKGSKGPMGNSIAGLRVTEMPATPIRVQVSRTGNEAKLTQVTAGGDEIHYLHWDGEGGAIKMKLPPGNGPTRFYTAALSGCSVFVVGPATSPTVYHCGIMEWKKYAAAAEGNKAPQTTAESTAIWRDLVAHDLGPGGPEAMEVNKGDYMKGEAGNGNTTVMRAMADVLEHKTGVSGATVLPATGAVFGERGDDGQWKFYLQENATLKWTDASGVEHSENRPIALTQFYPAPERGKGSLPLDWMFV